MGLPRKFNIDDFVNWTNDNGVNLGKRKIIGFGKPRGGENTYFLDPIDTPWFPIRESRLVKYDPAKHDKKAAR